VQHPRRGREPASRRLAQPHPVRGVPAARARATGSVADALGAAVHGGSFDRLGFSRWARTIALSVQTGGPVMKTTRKLFASTGAVVVLTVVATLSGATGAAARGVLQPDRSAHDRVVAFWTNARVAQAIPRDFDFDPKSRSFRPSAKPAAGGGGASNTTLGSSWTAGGEVLKTTGKVLFAMGGTYYVCSASVADDSVSGRSVILTAAHCAYDESGEAFATNWMFVPDYDRAPASLDTSGSFCAGTSLGCWTASAL